ncbi:hypothetical protein [Roseospira navarrensis]|uniref:Uncharacterized protein n=1 Tax=Roseospira navarrensis TaxID=140058 RepID=A0A7X1ZE45_9PROT|nr:hypothetical protein [Roseospira navarrensis]MQX36860.1 hypothetical protein [Roseospira navarrensis]
MRLSRSLADPESVDESDMAIFQFGQPYEKKQKTDCMDISVPRLKWKPGMYGMRTGNLS